MGRPHSIKGLKTKQAEVPWRRGNSISRLSTDTSCSIKLPWVSACLPTLQILNFPVSWKTDAFKLWCWKRLLRIPWTTRRTNQSILKEINPEYSLEGLMLKLKFQYFGHLMWRVYSAEKTLMLGKIEGKRRRGRQKTRLLDSITKSMDMNLSKFQEIVEDRRAPCAAVHGVAKSWTWQWLNSSVMIV